MPQPVLLFPFSLLFASDAAHTTGVGKVGGVDGGTNTVQASVVVLEYSLVFKPAEGRVTVGCHACGVGSSCVLI